VSEDAFAGYGATFSGACNSSGSVTLTAGADVTCTITNDDIPATLHVIKTVINNSGGVAVASAFSLHVKLSGTDVTGSPAAGTGTPGTSYSLATGTYVVSEDAFAGYGATFSGACNSSGSVTLTAGADVTCTITNDDIPLATAIPTLSEWALIVLAAFMAITGFVAMRRKER
jgi:Fe-S cluster biogenesis protein NfuA